MLLIAIDAIVLIFLLKAINQDEIGLGTAFIVALLAAIGTSALAYGLGSLLGLAGVFVGALLGALLLGVAVSALFGVEIKRAFLIGVIFIVAHIGAGIGLQMMMS